MRLTLLDSYELEIVNNLWAAELAFTVPGAGWAIALPDDHLRVGSHGDTTIPVPSEASTLAVRPNGKGFVAALSSGDLVLANREGQIRRTRSRKNSTIEAMKFDDLGQLWVVSQSKTDRQLCLEKLDLKLAPVVRLKLNLFDAAACTLAIDPSGALVAVNSHYGPEASRLTLCRSDENELNLLETWPSEEEDWAGSFQITSFGSTTDPTIVEDPSRLETCIYAAFERTLALLLCPEITVGVDGAIDEGEECESLAIHGDNLWLTVSHETGWRLDCIDKTLGSRHACVELPSDLVGARVLANDRLLTFRHANRKTGKRDHVPRVSAAYAVSLWEISMS